MIEFWLEIASPSIVCLLVFDLMLSRADLELGILRLVESMPPTELGSAFRAILACDRDFWPNAGFEPILGFFAFEGDW